MVYGGVRVVSDRKWSTTFSLFTRKQYIGIKDVRHKSNYRDIVVRIGVTDKRTDGQMDGQTDIQTDGHTLL